MDDLDFLEKLINDTRFDTDEQFLARLKTEMSEVIDKYADFDEHTIRELHAGLILMNESTEKMLESQKHIVESQKKIIDTQDQYIGELKDSIQKLSDDLDNM